ncbi:zcchc10 protein [Anaeramoeba flamelloides]|uniref:Zcchc10 protein n=1 Tax=Anaeramoeba flamelloides TaxID=1746091 RepID=A0AAV7ZHD2_9EUKA|nr:zcchc10 protein [Anaeramoeba flamelloides]
MMDQNNTSFQTSLKKSNLNKLNTPTTQRAQEQNNSNLIMRNNINKKLGLESGIGFINGNIVSEQTIKTWIKKDLNFKQTRRDKKLNRIIFEWLLRTNNLKTPNEITELINNNKKKISNNKINKINNTNDIKNDLLLTNLTKINLTMPTSNGLKKQNKKKNIKKKNNTIVPEVQPNKEINVDSKNQNQKTPVNYQGFNNEPLLRSFLNFNKTKKNIQSKNSNAFTTITSKIPQTHTPTKASIPQTNFYSKTPIRKTNETTPRIHTPVTRSTSKSINKLSEITIKRKFENNNNENLSIPIINNQKKELNEIQIEIEIEKEQKKEQGQRQKQMQRQKQEQEQTQEHEHEQEQQKETIKEKINQIDSESNNFARKRNLTNLQSDKRFVPKGINFQNNYNLNHNYYHSLSEYIYSNTSDDYTESDNSSSSSSTSSSPSSSSSASSETTSSADHYEEDLSFHHNNYKHNNRFFNLNLKPQKRRRIIIKKNKKGNYLNNFNLYNNNYPMSNQNLTPSNLYTNNTSYYGNYNNYINNYNQPKNNFNTFNLPFIYSPFSKRHQPKQPNKKEMRIINSDNKPTREVSLYLKQMKELQFLLQIQAQQQQIEHIQRIKELEQLINVQKSRVYHLNPKIKNQNVENESKPLKQRIQNTETNKNNNLNDNESPCILNNQNIFNGIKQKNTDSHHQMLHPDSNDLHKSRQDRSLINNQPQQQDNY